MTDYSRLPVEHYTRPWDPWPFLAGVVLGVIGTCILFAAVRP